jgi:uncharacterized protein with ATP-grasp and redox domains
METLEITFNKNSVAGKNLLVFLEQNKKYIKVKDPYKMTKEEFEEKCNEAREQFERGECKTLKPENIKKFLGLE